VLIHYAVTSQTGDMTGGWSIDALQLRIGATRVAFPFFAGLLLCRVAKLTTIRNAFPICSLLLVVVLAFPRIGGSAHFWANGLYESLTIVFIFPLVVYLGASGQVRSRIGTRVCKFLGDISYPIYITHYPLIYIYTGWVSDHKGVSFLQAFPYALATIGGAIVLAYGCLKLYDEPVRAWLQRKIS
jgi:peptidoglycan/LPS O-acetylase OafA/YrhL